MRRGTGFFTTVYEKLGVDWKSPYCSSVEFLYKTGILDTRPLLAHCITVSNGDIEIISGTGSTVAHCPKSNAKFGHGYAPFERLADGGVAIGLGSDSVASNNVCDIFEEMRFAAFAARSRPGRTRRAFRARRVPSLFPGRATPARGKPSTGTAVRRAL